MATETVTDAIDMEVELHNAAQISILINWIERARAASEAFEYALQLDPAFKERCRENRWFSADWDNEESEALVFLLNLQGHAICRVIQHNEAVNKARYEANKLKTMQGR